MAAVRVSHGLFFSRLEGSECVLRFSHLQKARVGGSLLFEAFRFLKLCLLFVLEKGFRLPSHGQAGSQVMSPTCS